MTPAPLATRANPPAALELPPAHLELAWRPLRSGDTAALYELVSAIEEADGVPHRMSKAEVTAAIEDERTDLQADSIAGFDDRGTLRAYGVARTQPEECSCVCAVLTGGVHPQWRGHGLGRAILHWMEGRGRQKLAATGLSVPARLAAYVDESARDQRRMYAAAGFSPVRWYAGMCRDLSYPLPDAPVPAGVRLVEWSEGLGETVRRTHGVAFAECWGTGPSSPESWCQGPLFASEWSVIAVDGAGDVVGYALSERRELSRRVQRCPSGFTSLVGVIPAWRGKGLGTALLGSVTGLYRDAGMRCAALVVDTANTTGAYSWLERLGYVPTYETVLYSVEI